MNEIKKEKIVQFFRQMLEVYDFELVIDINKDLENVFRLNDIQNGNLNGINQEEFYTLSDIIERLDTYHQDIVYIPLENKKSNNEKIAKDDWDLVAKRYLESETVERALNEIDTKKYVDLISKKEKFDIQDIIKILDEDEQFCKSVCKKYVDTMSKEMLLEIDNKILHIFIEDEYIKLKEEGKINNQNYKEYLDGNFNVYEYDSYQELYNSVIKVEIVYDLNDLELFDENGNWNFYITFEELKKVEISDSFVPYIANVTADYVTKKEEVKPLLASQVSSSVRWQQTIERLITDGADEFVEIGPGRTLSGFVKKVNRDVKVSSIDKMEDFIQFIGSHVEAGAC